MRRSSFQAKHINDSMFIEDDLVGWTQRCQYNVTFENNDNTCMLVSRLLLDNRYYHV